MLATELAVNTIPPVTTADSIQRALDRMVEFRIRHLPIVNEQQFVGLLAEADIAEPDHQLPVGNLSQFWVNCFVFENQHVYDIYRMFHENQLTVLPVLNINKQYIGLITLSAVANSIAELAGVTEPGGIIVLEINNKDNSLAHMAQIVESDNAHIMSSFVRTFPHSTRMEVTLKLNKPNISSINAAFLRYGYDVKAIYSQNDGSNESLDRYESFMNYLNM